ncbi:MAG: ABC transporter permease, partial [Mesorhizobium sp.]
MITYLGRRAFHSILSVIGLLTLVFFLTRLTGDPSALYLPLDSTAEARAAFARLNGLDQPIYWQFLEYLRDLLQLDFGESLRQNRSAMQVALEAFPETLKLAAVAMTLSTALAILVGSLAAARPGSIFDCAASLVSLAGASAPDFWIAIVGILVFAV